MVLVVSNSRHNCIAYFGRSNSHCHSCRCAVDVDDSNNSDDNEEGWDGRDGDNNVQQVVVMLVVVPLT